MAEKEYKSCSECIHYEICYKIEHFGRELESTSPCEQFLGKNDVAPVKHGHWVYQSSRKYINTDTNEEKLQKEILGYGGRVILNLQCSVCRKVTMVFNSISYEHCPHCGAKMDMDGGHGE